MVPTARHAIPTKSSHTCATKFCVLHFAKCMQILCVLAQLAPKTTSSSDWHYFDDPPPHVAFTERYIYFSLHPAPNPKTEICTTFCGSMLGTLSSERRLVPGTSAHGHASTCRRPLLLSVCSSMPLVVVFRAPAHRVAAAALSLPALPPKGGALLRVSAPITLAALDGVCSSLICAQQNDKTILLRLILSVSIPIAARWPRC